MYSGMEMASAIARKSQSAETDNGAQYISFTDLGPAITRFDSVDANTNACTGPWLLDPDVSLESQPLSSLCLS